MNKFPLLLTILSLLPSLIYSSLEDIKSRYTIKEGKLITYSGQEYSPIRFNDVFHEQMAQILMDPEYAVSISQAFQRHFVPILDQNSLHIFANALVKICQVLSPNFNQTKDAFFKALKEEMVSYDSWDSNHLTALKNFLSAICFETYEKGMDKEKMQVVIITTTTSGGNLSVAKAVNDLLNRHSNLFETTLIDYETFAERYDPIKIATGVYTTDSIYKMLQQEGITMADIIEKDKICQEVAKYIPYRTGKALKEHIKSLNPDLIISTRNYYADDFNLLSLGIPFRMLNCDHDICFFHETLVGKVDPKQVKFWLPSASPRFFKDYFLQRNCPHLYDENDNWNTLLEKIAKVAHSTFDEIRSQFEVIGYPIRLEIEPIGDPNPLEKLRNDWDLRNEEKGIVVEMGANGGAPLEEVFQKLEICPSHDLPIKYYFVCGRNIPMKHKLEKRLASIGKPLALTRCEVLGWVEAKEKNELMNICSLMIGKPGGATQAELTQLQLPLFIMHVHEYCEEGNKEKLHKCHLAYEYDPTKPLSIQIEETLEKTAHTKPISDPLDWKKNILDLSLPPFQR